MKRVLFDTNIILDIALKRPSYFDEAVASFSLMDEEKIIGCVTASTITDVYYITRKEKTHETAIAFISDLIEIVEAEGLIKIQ